MNDLTINQSYAVVNSILKQATGNANISVVDGNQFATVATSVLKNGYDPLLNAISQVITRTIFSNRPYSRKFKGLQVSNQRFGNITRKLNVSDTDFENDDRYTLKDGQAVDQYIVKKPNVLQTNFYGSLTYQKHITLFKDQLDVAFTSPEELARFTAMVMQNISDQKEQVHENMARAVLSNFIAGKIAGDTANVIHLVQEYNDLTGLALTTDTAMKPENFPSFMKFVSARIKTLSGYLTERSEKYHINITGKNVQRHTPLSKQKCYLYAPIQNQVATNVLADVFNKDEMKMIDYEEVNFWQSIDSPDGINIKPVYMHTDGTLKQPESATVQSDIFGVIFDEEALGYTVVNEWSQPTPFNARGGYTNIFWHWTERYWNDFTENGIVLLLD